MDILSQLRSLLNYSFFDVSLLRISVAIMIFFGILLLRGLFARVVFGIAGVWTRRTRTSLDDRLLDTVGPPVRFLFVALAVWAFGTVLRLPKDAADFANHIVRTMVAISVIWAAYRATHIVSSILEKLTLKTETTLDDHLLPIIQKAVRSVVVVLGVVILVQEWGYDVGGLIAGLGLGGLAFALAAKDTVSNYFGCLVILLDKPFAAGDWIKTSTVEGTVEDVSFRSTRVRTFAQALVTVPNATLASDTITNWSRMGKRRINFSLGVTYSTTGEQMKECICRIKEMLRSHPDIHQETIFVEFTDFGSSALEIFLYFFTKTTVWGEFLKVRTDVNLKIMKIVEELGMSVAFPSRSIYIENTGDGGELALPSGRAGIEAAE